MDDEVDGLKRPVTSVVPKGSVPWPVLCNVFVNDLNDGTECKFTDDKKLRVMDDTPNSCTIIQKGFDRLENWSDRHFLKFSKGK